MKTNIILINFYKEKILNFTSELCPETSGSEQRKSPHPANCHLKLERLEQVCVCDTQTHLFIFFTSWHPKLRFQSLYIFLKLISSRCNVMIECTEVSAALMVFHYVPTVNVYWSMRVQALDLLGLKPTEAQQQVIGSRLLVDPEGTVAFTGMTAHNPESPWKTEFCTSY